ncbi:MAG: hypothetical protein GYB67_17165 [Chloroflexi bacterium]|nr:hypothetical protein [Chloroflexota bacterium]
MPYTVDWYLPERIMRIQLSEELTIADAEQLSNISPTYINQGTAPVHVLIDALTVEKYPTQIAQLSKVVKSKVDLAHLGWVIYATRSPLLKFVFSTVTQIAMPNVRLRVYETLDEALAFLVDRDVTLVDLLPPPTIAPPR